jgi:hypothetical protein
MKLFRMSVAGVSATLVFCAVALAVTPKRGHYHGVTSGQGPNIDGEQDRTVNFKVSFNGKKVTGFEVAYNAGCAGSINTTSEIRGSFVISSHGRFAGTGKLDGRADLGTGKVTGKFTSSRKASGTVRMRYIYDGEGGVEGSASEQCDTGILKWSAERG